MNLKFGIFRGCKLRDRRATCDVVAPLSSTSFDLRAEYASAFRTESYNEFWARVLDLTFANGQGSRGSSGAAARLPSYRLFTEHLLDPDQPTITKILARARTRCHPMETHILLSDYYSETANASLLCGILLKDIERIRLLYRPLKTKLHSLISDDSSSRVTLQAIDLYLADLSKTLNPFDSLPSFRSVQDGSHSLLKRLESSRKKATTKLRLVKRLKKALAVVLVVVTVSTSVIGVHIAVHGLVALVIVLPNFLPSSSRMLSSRWLARVLAQLDVAAKGTYILNRDLDTISRLVARLRDEVEHMVAMLRLCRDDRRRLTVEVVRQIWKNDASFNQQVDELEEHLYLCFMTINKARGLVMKEVLVSSTGGKGNRV